MAEAAAGGGPHDSGISRAALTPGSPLMLEVQASLSYYVCRALQGSRFAAVHFEITGSTVPVRPTSSSSAAAGPVSTPLLTRNAWSAALRSQAT